MYDNRSQSFELSVFPVKMPTVCLACSWFVMSELREVTLHSLPCLPNISEQTAAVRYIV
jgi:hypothetical protein